MVRDLLQHRKTQAQQVLKLGPDYARELDLVFANELGLPHNLRNLTRRHFDPILKRAKLGRASTYTLRHSHASQLAAEGVHTVVVSQRLGNTPRTTLEVYTHPSPVMQEEATARIERAVFVEKPPSLVQH